MAQKTTNGPTLTLDELFTEPVAAPKSAPAPKAAPSSETTFTLDDLFPEQSSGLIEPKPVPPPPEPPGPPGWDERHPMLAGAIEAVAGPVRTAFSTQGKPASPGLVDELTQQARKEKPLPVHTGRGRTATPLEMRQQAPIPVGPLEPGAERASMLPAIPPTIDELAQQIFEMAGAAKEKAFTPIPKLLGVAPTAGEVAGEYLPAPGQVGEHAYEKQFLGWSGRIGAGLYDFASSPGGLAILALAAAGGPATATALGIGFAADLGWAATKAGTELYHNPSPENAEHFITSLGFAALPFAHGAIQVKAVADREAFYAAGLKAKGFEPFFSKEEIEQLVSRIGPEKRPELPQVPEGVPIPPPEGRKAAPEPTGAQEAASGGLPPVPDRLDNRVAEPTARLAESQNRIDIVDEAGKVLKTYKKTPQGRELAEQDLPRWQRLQAETPAAPVPDRPPGPPLKRETEPESIARDVARLEETALLELGPERLAELRDAWEGISKSLQKVSRGRNTPDYANWLDRQIRAEREANRPAEPTPQEAEARVVAETEQRQQQVEQLRTELERVEDRRKITGAAPGGVERRVTDRRKVPEMSLEYEKAMRDARAASAAFDQVRRRYRAKEIGDEEFLAARRRHDEAMAKFEEVAAREEPGAVSEPPPEPPYIPEGVEPPPVTNVERETSPDIPMVRGRETQVFRPSGQDVAEYAVVEARDLQPSHDPRTFAKNPLYPEGVQERMYERDKNAQMDVERIGRDLEPEMLVNSDPTPTGGPPQIRSDGVVLGGNSRTMGVRRVYDSGRGDLYRRYLEEHAAEFGITPEQIAGLKEPVLVRVIRDAPKGQKELAKYASELNQGLTKGLGEVEAAISAGRKLTADSVERLIGEITRTGETATLREAMDSNSTLFRDILLEDGIVTPQTISKYFTESGNITPAGKDFIENALLGRVIGDADMLANLPRGMTAKLERSIPALIEIGARTDKWNIMPEVLKAAQMAADAQRRGWTLETYLSQRGLFEQPDARVQKIADLLLKPPTVVAKAFKRFASEARSAGEGKGLFEGAFDPVESFDRVFKAVEEGKGEPGIGQTNKIFTRDRLDAAQQRIREKLGGDTLTAGIDPTLLKDFAEVGGYYIEAGLREFGAWAERMIQDFGERIRPHLREVWAESLRVGRDSSRGAERAVFTSTDAADKTAQVEQMLGQLTEPSRTILAEGETTFERGTVRREIRDEFYGADRPGYEETYRRRISVEDIDQARNMLRDAHDTSVRWLEDMHNLEDEVAIKVGQSAVRYLNQASKLFKERGTISGRIQQAFQRRARRGAGLPREERAAPGELPRSQGGGLPEVPGREELILQQQAQLRLLIEQVRALIRLAEEQLVSVRTFRSREPVTTGLYNAIRDRRWADALRYGVDQLRLNLFSIGSWTLDAIGNASELGAQGMSGVGHDLVHVSRRGEVSFPSLTGFVQAVKSRWRSRGIPMDERIEQAFQQTVGGELIGTERLFPPAPGRRMTTQERLQQPGAFTYRSTPASTALDLVQGIPLYAKGAMDTAAKRLSATAILYRDAIKAADAAGIRNGAQRDVFIQHFLENLPNRTIDEAIREGKKAGFDRKLSETELAVSRSVVFKLFGEAFPRWGFQFTRWAGEMLGLNPQMLSKFRSGTATPEEFGAYLAKTATGYGGLMLINELLYDRTDFNSMEYVDEQDNRVRLSGREPIASALVFLALIRGDVEKAAAGLRNSSIPFSRVLTGEGGLASSMFEATYQAARNPQNDPRALRRELETRLNRAIPGQALLSTIEGLADPQLREGIGAGIPGYSSLLPEQIDPTTGEPKLPTQRLEVPFVGEVGPEFPAIQGTPIPGMARQLNPVEKLLNRFGLAVYRGMRHPIAGFPAAEIPPDMRREWEQEFGRERQRRLMPLAQDFLDGKLGKLAKEDEEKIRAGIQRIDGRAARYAARVVSDRYPNRPKPERQPTLREAARPKIYQ